MTQDTAPVHKRGVAIAYLGEWPFDKQPWLDTSEDDSGEEKDVVSIEVKDAPSNREILAQRIVFACVGRVPADIDSAQLVSHAFALSRSLNYPPGRDLWFVVSWIESQSQEDRKAG